MPQGPAARITDNVAHPLPPVLTPGPGSLNTLIGFLPAWRGIPTAAAAGIMAAKQAADIAVQAAVAATAAAVGPAIPIAYAAEQTLKASTLAAMSSTIMSAAAGADIHMCVTPSPVPPHGPGVVVDGSPTVLINNLPACRLGDTIIEPLGPPNKIVKGEPTVIIGQMGRGSGCSAAMGAANAVSVAPIQRSHAPASWITGGSGQVQEHATPIGSAADPRAQANVEAKPPSDLDADPAQQQVSAMRSLVEASRQGTALVDCGPG